MTDPPACKHCGLPTGGAGYCRRTRACNAARSKALYDQARGPVPACAACGYPLGRRRGQYHGQCRKRAREILLARLAEDMNLLEARRHSGGEARRQASARVRRQREAEQRTALIPVPRCPGCGKPLGSSGRCWRSPRCIDAAIRAQLSEEAQRLYARPGSYRGARQAGKKRAMQDTG